MIRVLLSVMLSAGLASQLPGCSWTFSGRVPENYHLSKPLQCTAYGLPVADFMNAGYFAAMALSPPKGMGDNTTEGLSWVVLGAYSTVGLLFLISGLTGIFWSANCHDTYVAHRHWMQEEKLRILKEKSEPPEKNLPPIPGITPEAITGAKQVEKQDKKPKKVTKKRRPRKKRSKRRRIRRKKKKTTRRRKKKKKRRKRKARSPAS